jgi:hypothetical protein
MLIVSQRCSLVHHLFPNRYHNKYHHTEGGRPQQWRFLLGLLYLAAPVDIVGEEKSDDCQLLKILEDVAPIALD